MSQATESTLDEARRAAHVGLYHHIVHGALVQPDPPTAFVLLGLQESTCGTSHDAFMSTHVKRLRCVVPWIAPTTVPMSIARADF